MDPSPVEPCDDYSLPLLQPVTAPETDYLDESNHAPQTTMKLRIVVVLKHKFWVICSAVTQQ